MSLESKMANMTWSPYHPGTGWTQLRLRLGRLWRLLDSPRRVLATTPPIARHSTRLTKSPLKLRFVSWWPSEDGDCLETQGGIIAAPGSIAT